MGKLPSAVLFACSANAVRSPMAAALFRRAFGGRAYVDSVGVRAEAADPFVGAVLAELGIGGFADHRPKSFEDLHDGNFEVIVALTREAHDRALEFTRTNACEVLFWPADDPARVEGNRETRLEAYRRLRDDLATRIAREWPDAAFAPPEPGIPEETAAALTGGRKLRGAKVLRRGRDLWSRMRVTLRRLRR
jgi:protein-tyrosine-phosphatase